MGGGGCRRQQTERRTNPFKAQTSLTHDHLPPVCACFAGRVRGDLASSLLCSTLKGDSGNVANELDGADLRRALCTFMYILSLGSTACCLLKSRMKKEV